MRGLRIGSIVFFLFLLISGFGLFNKFHESLNLKEFEFDYNMSIDVPNNIEKIKAIIPKGNITFEGSNDDMFRVNGKVVVKAKDNKEAEELFQEYGSITTINDYIQFKAKKSRSNFGQYLTSADLTITLPQEMMVEMEINKGDVQANHLIKGIDVKFSKGDLSLNDIKGDIKVDHDKGNIEGNQLKGEIRIKLNKGDINLRELVPIQDSFITLAKGDIDISVPTHANLRVKESTVKGKIDRNLVLSDTNTNTPTLTINTKKGDITLFN